MSPGPLRRLSGLVGLLALAPTAWMLAIGALTLPEAAFRAAATLVVVLVVGRLAGGVVEALAVTVDARQPPGDETEAQAPEPSHDRRRTDGGSGVDAARRSAGEESRESVTADAR